MITFDEDQLSNTPIINNGSAPTGLTAGTIGSLLDINVSATERITGYKSIVQTREPDVSIQGAEFIANSDGTENRNRSKCLKLQHLICIHPFKVATFCFKLI